MKNDVNEAQWDQSKLKENNKQSKTNSIDLFNIL